MKRFLFPLLAFGALVVLLALGLRLNPSEVPSPLIGNPAPAFKLSSLEDPAKSVSPEALQGQVWLLNVWASWCGACRQEHAALLAFARSSAAPVIGLNYKDARADGLAWLERYGNPYRMSAHDLDGRVGIDFGVYAVPETFVIDKRGIIRFKVIGILTPKLIEEKLNPLIQELNRA